METEHGEQFALDSPYEAKDDIKDLDWEETHRTWDSDRKAWLVDADSVDEVSRELEEAGWEVDETDD